jgi:hypothetical protein
LLAKIKALREAGLRAEHVAFSLMKRRVQPLMARNTLGYQYTSEGDSSRMPDGEIDTTTSSTGWAGSLRTCRHTHTVQSRSTPPRAHRTRSVAILNVEYLLCSSSHAHPMCFLQDDIVKFVFKPAAPPRLVEIPEEGKGKAKEHHEVGEGDNTVVVKDTSNEDDEETLQERFLLRSRFSCPRLPNVPLIQDPPTSLEASLPAPPRRLRNVARKRVAKKLKVTETTSQQVKSMSRVVEYLFLDVVYADNKILLLAGDSAFRPRRPRGRRRPGDCGGAG